MSLFLDTTFAELENSGSEAPASAAVVFHQHGQQVGAVLGPELNLRSSLVMWSRTIAKGIRPRKPVAEYLTRQGRFAHMTKEDIAHFQSKVDESWEKWWIPGLVPFGVREEA